MTARLRAITFDQQAENYLTEAMAEDEAGLMALAERDAFGDIADLNIRLKKAPSGDYLLVVGGDLRQNTTASFKLINAETNDVLYSTSLELHPLVLSAIGDAAEFDELGKLSLDDDVTVQAEADRQAELINIRRSQYLEGLLSPYLENNILFNVELLDMLDFMTYPTIKGDVDIDCDNTDEVQAVRHPPQGKYTLH